jgi:hypothetical protein
MVNPLIPPRTHCPKCGRSVSSAWNGDGRRVFLSPYPRHSAPYVIADNHAGRRIVIHRQEQLFRIVNDNYGYDLHDCKVEDAIAFTTR